MILKLVVLFLVAFLLGYIAAGFFIRKQKANKPNPTKTPDGDIYVINAIDKQETYN